MNNKTLIYVGFAFKHHKGTHGGYHQIKDFIQYDKIIDCQNFIERNDTPPTNIITKFIRKVLNKLIGFPTIPYYLLYCIWLTITKKNLVFHFIYGENTYKWLHIFCGKTNKIILTLHQPLEYFQNNKVWLKRIKKVNAIILVGNQELESFKKVTQQNNIYFIPHGIRTDFYNPNKDIPKEKMILTVGNWLRDYVFANEVYQKLFERYKELSIYIVSNPINKKFIIPHENIHFLNNISDDELKNLYQRCSCLFLPLKRYTANNALLEAAATGCQIAIASNEPDNSYIPEDLLKQTDLSTIHCISMLNECIKNSEIDYRISNFVKNNYDWNIIAKQIKELYQQL